MCFAKLVLTLLVSVSLVGNTYTSCKISRKICFHKLNSKLAHCAKQKTQNKKDCCEKVNMETSYTKKFESFLLVFFFLSKDLYFFQNPKLGFTLYFYKFTKPKPIKLFLLYSILLI